MGLRERYNARARALEPKIGHVVNGVFSLTSVLIHVVVYTAFILAEGPPLTIFLNCISIEAVFVSLFVGIRTKLNDRELEAQQRDRDDLQDMMEEHVENDERLTGDIHALMREVHEKMTEGKR